MILRFMRRMLKRSRLLRAQAVVHQMRPAEMTDEELRDWWRGRHVALRPEIAEPVAPRTRRPDWSRQGTIRIEHRGRVS